MGERVEPSALVGDTGHVVQRRLERCVAALRRMVDDGWFDGHEDTIGMEVEFDLVDPLGRPRLINDAVLTRLGRADMQHELGQFNVELNLAPRRLEGQVLRECEADLADVFDRSRAAIEGLGVRLVAVGMLPTVSAEQLTVERISHNPRYELLARRMRAARHRPFAVRIADGCEPVEFSTDSVAPDAATTSLQLHLRVPPDRFAAYYNAAQMIAGAQVAVAANAPYLLGYQAWQETRIPLLEQLLDSRRLKDVRAGAPPRVRLGDRWVDDPVELFDDIVRDFPPLLPTMEAQDPDAALDEGRAPNLRELRLHNGTVWRWNRPVYDVQAGRPQLRIENRVLPSGPTAVDMLANAAYYYGLLRAVSDSDPAPWDQVPFAVAERNLHRAARDGLAAQLSWRGVDYPVDRLTREVLLPAAAAGLDAWGVDPDDRDRYLGVIEARVRGGRTGAAWQVDVVRRLQERGLERIAALHEMTRRYVEHAHTGAPVHDWPVA
ncbi:glutamate-cysteine ligase family protein [Mycolicibacterium sp. ND9-15]|uniref:glutamate-cysteine ligase family protein n=1 Tax=Mycolicibacterium sp. ND9-15 TaxID=3042320 RepID=UPI002DDC788E|nr:glutamate-cysteine ligase family protein [Mycolicibacterium sp. ND9-15]WSE57745.1 glutamate-cysteine ligase family protein [Mycolicibacterium sp. ND9-15]